MDRVRDLVAAGGVSFVLAQDRDRFAREPAYHYLLRREFEEHGCKIRALTDRGDDSPEGELTDGILDQLAKYERAKTTERTRRGKLQKARKGKLIRNSRAHYGFEHDNTGEGYVVKEEEMRVVRRIFRTVADGHSLYSVKRSLELDGVAPPGNGATARGQYWGVPFLRKLIEDDVYRLHTREDIAGLVAEGLLLLEVAASLDKSVTYGVSWFNRTRTTRKRISKAGSTDKEYRWQKTVRQNPREQWVAIPVPDAGIPLEVVNTARKMMRYNGQSVKTSRRFWEIPGGAVRCAGCGTRMLKYSSMARGRSYAYYKCSRIDRNGKDACSPDRHRTCHRAEKLEQTVWELVSGLLKNPEQLRADLERMIDLEREGTRGDPEREMKTWFEKLSEIDQMRRGYQEQAAKGLMTLEELGAALGDLGESRRTAEQELEAIKGRQVRIEQLERDKEALLQQYSDVAPEALDALTAEERHHAYTMLQLERVMDPRREYRLPDGGRGKRRRQSATLPKRRVASRNP
jgi:site-specific DNA recombinase